MTTMMATRNPLNAARHISRGTSIASVFIVSIAVVAWLVAVLPAPSEAKKTKPTHKSFGELVERRHSCEVCRMMVHEAVDQSDELHNNATRRGYPLREEEILTQIMDGICNPYVKAGHWLRLIQIFADESGGTSRLRAIDYFSKCKRACTTLASACVAVLDSDEADGLPALLLRKQRNVENVEDHVCGDVCRMSTRVRSKRLPERVLTEIEKEAVERIEAKELEMETLMDDMERARGGSGGAPPMDVFARDEMLDMKDAILHGNLDRLRELDPSAEDLTEEDFEYLRLMYQNGGDMAQMGDDDFSGDDPGTDGSESGDDTEGLL